VKRLKQKPHDSRRHPANSTIHTWPPQPRQQHVESDKVSNHLFSNIFSSATVINPQRFGFVGERFDIHVVFFVSLKTTTTARADAKIYGATNGCRLRCRVGIVHSIIVKISNQSCVLLGSEFKIGATFVLAN
jgi:hypothetical protein